ncbi:MAG: GTP-binding protein [Hyphomicrobiaceae bacterium]
MIPVTVLTGFLGSGKTTLLARLVQSPQFARTAVIVNELGEVGIDHHLVEVAEESFVKLDTGCICCEARGDIEAALADLVARRRNGALPPFERIVIETSGAADPAPLLNAVMAETGRDGAIVLDGVVTTVDAVNGRATLLREPQSVRQVAVADRLVITKTDLTGGSHDPALLAHLDALNPRAARLVAIDGDIAAAALIGDSGAGGASAEWRAALQVMPPPAPHDAEIGCIVVRRTDPLPAVSLTLLLEALADHCGSDLLRLKGIVHVAEQPDRPAVVHGVQHVFHAPRWLDRWPSEDHSTRLVLIGRGLSRLWVESLIDALVAEVTEIAAQPVV